MNHRRPKPCDSFGYYESPRNQARAWVGSVSNKHNPSTKSGLGACISSRITTVIHVMNHHQINYNCFNEPFAVSPYRNLYWDMHGLIFETSIWLLAGSTRLLATKVCSTSACGLQHIVHAYLRAWTSLTMMLTNAATWDNKQLYLDACTTKIKHDVLTTGKVIQYVHIPFSLALAVPRRYFTWI